MISVDRIIAKQLMNPFDLVQRDFSLLAIFILLLTSCNQELTKTSAEDFKMSVEGTAQGTTYSVGYYDLQERNLKPHIDSLLDRIDQSISTYKPGSVIDRWNSSEHGVKVDRLFMEVLIESWLVYSATDGAFDPTVKPLVSYWGFGPEKFESHFEIDQMEIDRLSRLIGLDSLQIIRANDTIAFDEMANLELMNDSIFLYKPNSEIQLDFNAIGQGWSVDKVASFLYALDIEVFFVEIGGEIVAGKPKPNGEMWRFGIDKPENDSKDRELQAIVNLRNRAVATSGNYRKFYLKDGEKFSHTIDPKSGRPVQHNLLSATVFSSSAAEADAMATAFMVIGKDSTLSYLAENAALGDYVYLIYDSLGTTQTYMSPQVEGLIEEQ